MRLKLNLSRPDGSHTDLMVTLDADCTVGALAERIANSDPHRPSTAHNPASTSRTLVRGGQSGPVTLNPAIAVLESGLASGSSIALADAPTAQAGTNEVWAVLHVLSGPDAGRSFDLRAGSNTVGRGRQCSVQLADPMVSTLHARIVVGETIEIVDENSSNGILMGDQQVSRVTLGADDTVLLGEDIVSVRPASARITGTAGAGVAGPTIEFNRSPRVDPTYEGEELAPPEPPSPPQKHRFPIVSIVAPVLMAGVLIAVMQNWMFVIFLALSPIMLVGNHIEQKRNSKADLQEATDHFHSSLARVVASAHALHDQERARRGVEHPGTAEILEAMSNLGVLLWTRRPEHDRFMELRLGLGSQPSRLRFDVNPGRNAIPALADELDEVLNRFAYIDRVPIVGSFDVSGSIGVAGPESAAADVARGVMMQVLGLHSPAEVVVCALASSLTAERWEWLKWVPHTSSDHSPLEGAHLASSPPGCSNLVAELTDLVLVRQGEQSSSDEAPLPRVVVLVENDAPVERNRLVLLAEKGPEVGVHLIWVAGHRSQIPAACRSFLEIDAIDGTAATGRVVEGETSRPVLVEPVDLSHAAAIARALSPVVDAGALPSDQTDLPSNVLFLSDAGAELALLPDAVLERWTESRSVFPPAQFPEGAPRPASRRSGGLRALVGRGKGDNVYLDLRTQGPHALVGGTTGSGKSEFLQTWIMGMATAHGPQRVTFLFVDYKGGAAFADCVRLPHCVGLVTDLSPLLVRRALKSLRAELRHREHLLNRYGAKDLLEMEMAGNPETPPSLVIVVDEFAALVQEVPDFVDGVVDVAQRGRSLGLHLILATQRPAGVIKDNLRANTNLRVALRVADEDDSRDVIGTAEAAGFDPSIPGRAVVKSGPGRLEAFQSGYVGGWTRTEAPPPSIRLEVLSFGSAAEWEVPEPAAGLLTEDQGPTDIERLCDQVVEAARTAGLPAPRRPWLPELSPVYELANLQLPRTDTDLAFGVIDDPDAQDQRVVAFHPDVDGNMAVYGTGGSGKSTFLRTIAVAAGLTVRGGPCAVYGLDFGARGLQMLEVLPHVGSIVNGDDDERVARLLRELRETIDDRARRYASAQAGTICEYRGSAGFPDEPRILLLIDGMGAMRAAYESSRQSALLDLLTTIAVDGRQVGVHLVVSADRTGAIPNALAGTIQRNLVLRLASDMDLMTLGAPADGFTRSTPPGRGFVDDLQVQVAVLGGSANVAVQATSIERLAVRLHREGVLDAPVVQSLEDHIPLGSLPVALDRSGMPCDSGSDAEPAFAVADDTLGPVGLDLGTPFLVAGPAGSGRTSTVRTLVSSIGRLRADARFVLLGQRRSTLPASGVWERCALGVDEVARLAGELAEEIEARNAGMDRLVLVVEGIGEFLNTDADYPLVELLKAARSEDLPVIAEGETSTLSGGWPLLSPVKNARHGIVLQPDQIDGDALFSTGFGRMSRADFPPGRGMYVRGGRATRVQVAEA